ncbi:MAG: hypothetical protein QGG36_30665 [Pirellulaceae bacterium]|jgi:hypothetical protein|nr:hypothetical protein [Pirellulaceae bacterium]MDP7020200.1 hypothetical protein [Pirellulaceae bacterium]
MWRFMVVLAAVAVFNSLNVRADDNGRAKSDSGKTKSTSDSGKTKSTSGSGNTKSTDKQSLSKATNSKSPSKATRRKVAQANSAKSKSGSNTARGKSTSRNKSVTAREEALALKFVAEHHSELAALLRTLKPMDEAAYSKGIQDLHRASHRLTQIKQRDERAFELEVAKWRYHSRAQLVAARLRMNKSESHVKELRELLMKEFDAQVAILKHNRDRQLERLQRLEQQIDRIEKSREHSIQRQITQVLGRQKTAKTKASPNRDVKKQKPAKRPSNSSPSGVKAKPRAANATDGDKYERKK